MPFAVWCHSCRPHALIAQGVRFNAAKRRVGHYHSTPVWSFRLRHPACGGTIEIRTDPQHTAYVVTEGGKARDYGDADDKVREGEGGVPILTPEERERRREDAFARLEGQAEEKAQVKDNTKRIAELYESRERDWDDPWSANKRMRNTFRQQRKVREKEEKADEALKDRLGTDIDLLPETAADSIQAKMIEFGADAAQTPGDSASSKALFHTSKATSSLSRTRASKPAKESRREALRRKLISNTRAAMNPFG